MNRTAQGSRLGRAQVALRALAILALAGAGGEVAAQQPPEGIALGSFRLDPRFDLSQDYTDNVLLRSTGEESDQVTRATPSLSARSNWKRHALNANLSLTEESHSRFKSESVDTYVVSIDGRIDGGQTLQFPASISSSLTSLKRGHPNEAGGRTRSTDTTQSVTAGALWTPGSWQLDLGTKRQGTDSKDSIAISGAPINRDDEDRVQYDHSVKLGYKVASEFSIFGKLVRTRVDYSDPFDDNLQNRDSTGHAVSAGLVANLGPGRSVSLEAGREQRKFAGVFGQYDGPTVSALALWAFFPTLVGTLNHVRMFQETVLPGSPGLTVEETALNLVWGAGKPWHSDLTLSRTDSTPVGIAARYRVDTVALHGQPVPAAADRICTQRPAGVRRAGAWIPRRCRHRGADTDVLTARRKAHLRRTAQELPYLLQRSDPGLVHIDHHPLMIGV